MAEAELTAGAFYKHFESEDYLVQQVCALVLQQLFSQARQTVEQRPGESRMTKFVGMYLSAEHVENPSSGCGFAALGQEMGRVESLNSIARSAFEDFASMIREFLPTDAHPAGGTNAMAAAMVGAIVLARAIGKCELGKEILSDTAIAIHQSLKCRPLED